MKWVLSRLLLFLFSVVYATNAQTITDTLDLSLGGWLSVAQFTPKQGSAWYGGSAYAVGRNYPELDSSTSISRTWYQFTWSSGELPTNATITQATVTYSIASGNYTFNITKIPNLGSTDLANWTAVGNGAVQEQGIPYGSGSIVSSNVKTAVQSALSTQQLILGVISQNETANDSKAVGSPLSVRVIFTRTAKQLSFAARNDLEGGSGGSIGVGVAVSPASHGSPYDFPAYEAQTVNLLAYDNQYINAGTWVFNNSEAPVNVSDWKRDYRQNFVQISYSQSCSFVADTNYNNAAYIAFLKTYRRISRSDVLEFDGTTSVGVVDSAITENSCSISAPSQQTINGRDYRFYGWSDGITSNPRTVTPSGSTTLTAKYKANLASSISSATGTTSQRRLIRDLNGKLHLIYESSGEIWYTRSTNNGTSWTSEVMLSSGLGSSHNSSMANIDDNHHSTYAVWIAPTQRTGESGYDVYLKPLNLDDLTWGSTEVLYAFADPNTDPPARVDAKPVMAMVSDNVAWPTSILVFEGVGSGLKYAFRYYNWDYEQYMWFVSNVTGTTTASVRPSIAYTFGGKAYLSYDNSSAVYLSTSNVIQAWYYTVGFGSPETVPSSNYYAPIVNSSVSIDYAGRVHVAWPGYDWGYEYPVVGHRSKNSSGTWSNLTLFYPDLSDPPFAATASVAGHYDLNNGGASLLISDGTVLYDLVANDGMSWTAHSFATYGAPIGHPNLVWEGMPDALSSVLTKNASAPYRLAFETRNYGFAKSTAQEQATRLPLNATVRRGVLLTESATGNRLDIRIGNAMLESEKGSTKLECSAGAVSSRSNSLRTRPFKANSAARVALDIKARGKWSRAGALRLVLAISSTGSILSELKGLKVSANDSIAFSQRWTFDLPPSADSVSVAMIWDEVMGEGVTTDYLTEMRLSAATSLAKQSSFPVSSEQESLVPTSTGLAQNYPNPFNPETRIDYRLSEPADVRLQVFDILGRNVATLVDGRRPAGYYSATWNAAGLPSGTYVIRLQAGFENEKQIVESKRMILAK